MAQSFPASLQQILNSGGFNYTYGNTLQRTQMDIGPAKVRNRFTNGIDVINASIVIDFDDYNTLTTFYKTTLANGSLTFNYDHPLTQNEAEFRFVSPPTVTPISGGGRKFSVSFSWELISE